MPFIGREDFIRAFEDDRVSVRRAPPGAPPARRYENISGEEGIGKTALADKLWASCNDADTVAAIRSPFSAPTFFLNDMARLRRRIGVAAPDLPCPRFEHAYSFLHPTTKPYDFKPETFLVGPVDLVEMFRKALDKMTSKSVELIASQLMGGAAAGGASVAASASGLGALATAMAAAFAAGVGGAAGFLTVLLANSYVIGIKEKSAKDAMLRACQPYQRILAFGPNDEMGEVRRALVLTLAEDLNDGLASLVPQARPLLTMFVDPADRFEDATDVVIAPYGDALLSLMRELHQAYVLTFSRSPPSTWERRFADLPNHEALNAVYEAQHKDLPGLSTDDVITALSARAGELGLEFSEVDEAAVRDLPKRGDGLTLLPATVRTYWNSKVTA